MQHPIFCVVFITTPMKTNIGKIDTINHGLIELCRNNDRNAQLSLYKQYCDGMFSVVMRYVRDANDAEDVLQESFIKAFRKIDQYKGEVAFGAWLKKIVINKSLDFLKARKHHLHLIEDSKMQSITDDDWMVEDHISMEDIQNAMVLLPDKYGLVLKLYLIEGYDHEEIAQIMNIKKSTSRTRLLRGKGQLKKVLINKGYGKGSKRFI